LCDLIGDIDILFDRTQKKQIYILMGELGFVEDKYSTAILDDDFFVFRGFSNKTNQGIMIHGHYCTRFGNKKTKPYCFNNDKKLINKSIDVLGVRTLALDDFYMVRLLSGIFKDKKVDPYLREVFANIPAAVVNSSDLKEFVEMIFGSEWPKLMQEIDVSQARWGEDYSLLANNYVINKRVNRFDQLNISAILGKYAIGLISRGKRNKIGMLRVVIAGHDGAGKSSAVQNVSDILKKYGTAKKIYLGRSNWSNDPSFNGSIDEFRIYNRALTQSEITYLATH
jgi:hypothetical protein